MTHTIWLRLAAALASACVFTVLSDGQPAIASSRSKLMDFTCEVTDEAPSPLPISTHPPVYVMVGASENGLFGADLVRLVSYSRSSRKSGGASVSRYRFVVRLDVVRDSGLVRDINKRRDLSLYMWNHEGPKVVRRRPREIRKK
jgi:hypothetical protein